MRRNGKFASNKVAQVNKSSTGTTDSSGMSSITKIYIDDEQQETRNINMWVPPRRAQSARPQLPHNTSSQLEIEINECKNCHITPDIRHRPMSAFPRLAVIDDQDKKTHLGSELTVQIQIDDTNYEASRKSDASHQHNNTSSPLPAKVLPSIHTSIELLKSPTSRLPSNRPLVLKQPLQPIKEVPLHINSVSPNTAPEISREDRSSPTEQTTMATQTDLTDIEPAPSHHEPLFNIVNISAPNRSDPMADWLDKVGPSDILHVENETTVTGKPPKPKRKKIVVN